MVSTGQNKYRVNGLSIHAETDAINRLPVKKTKILEKVSLLVIKTNRNCELSNSAPCVHCLKSMSEKPSQKGYRIDKVYYSNGNGEIECKKLTDLLQAGTFHISIYYRNNGYSMERWCKWRDNYIKKLYKL